MLTFKLFHMVRTEDVSGVSGEGVVAEACLFPDGIVAIQWRGKHASTVVHRNMESVNAIHGHDGKTRMFECNPMNCWWCDPGEYIDYEQVDQDA